jgi:hypothetical protein
LLLAFRHLILQLIDRVRDGVLDAKGETSAAKTAQALTICRCGSCGCGSGSSLLGNRGDVWLWIVRGGVSLLGSITRLGSIEVPAVRLREALPLLASLAAWFTALGQAFSRLPALQPVVLRAVPVVVGEGCRLWRAACSHRSVHFGLAEALWHGERPTKELVTPR